MQQQKNKGEVGYCYECEANTIIGSGDVCMFCDGRLVALPSHLRAITTYASVCVLGSLIGRFPTMSH